METSVKERIKVDEMKLKLSTKFMRGIVSKLISKVLYKQLGYKIDIQLNELNVTFVDGDTKILANVEASINNQELKRIIKEAGLED